ncbi:MAG: hypothetical protein J6K22_08480 [Spirochaetaceae bacterium]|nr:hypothetical protein [Spirochaetaceae bacterium]
MTIKQMQEKLNLEGVSLDSENSEITEVYTSDLLSDIMGNAPENSVLVTIQAHKNTVAVATLKESKAIIICNNRPIPEDMIEAAKSEEISIFRTEMNQYQISGKLYSLIESI